MTFEPSVRGFLSLGRALPLVAVMLACGCQEKSARAEKPAAPREVKLAPVEQGALERSIEVSGTLAADEQVTVAVKVPGRLAQVLIDLASVVKTGDEIARIEPTDYQLRVDQAAASVAQARVQLGLPAEGGNDEVDVEATAQVRQAKATLAESRSAPVIRPS